MKFSNSLSGVSVSCALALVLLSPVAAAARAQVAGTQASELEVFAALEAEASALRSTRPELWQSYVEQAGRVFEEHERTACWGCRGIAPPADLTPLDLPLPFLLAEVQDPREVYREPRGHYKESAYFDAIVSSPDRRRIAALVGLRAKRGQSDPRWDGSWARRIAGAADLEWATPKIRELIKPEPPLYESGLLTALLWRFARQLPKDLQDTAYDYVRPRVKTGPKHLGGDAYWALLLLLDAERARAEIIPYFDQYEYSLDVVFLLRDHAGPSPQVARAVRRWVATDRGKEWPQYLYVILLKSDPRGGVSTVVEYVDRELGAVRAGKSKRDSFFFHYFVDALRESDSAEAVQPLARYANERLIHDTSRLKAVGWLVKRRYEGAPQIVARWLAEEDDYRRKWLLQAVEKGEWGEEGRRALREAEAINQKKTPASPTGRTTP
ncbi:MAG TPA: hypothetical protein VK421_11520 [Pyrinomonadaceae bacterium]|nr:hypothetical protein [Pyrinomonadaceae bacterium]